MRISTDSTTPVLVGCENARLTCHSGLDATRTTFFSNADFTLE